MIEFTKSGLHYAGVVLAGAVAILMVNLDTTVVTIILPDIGRIFGVSADTVALINVSYLLSLTAFLPVFGKLSDRIGVERVFMPGYLLFSLCSLFCGLAPGVHSLMVARFFQGIGGAMVMATSAVIVVKYIPFERRGSVFGINGLMAGIGFALGAPVGGWLSTMLSWRWVFFVNIPLGILGFYLCSICLTKREKSGKLDGLDYRGALLAVCSLVCLVMTLSTAQIFHSSTFKLLAGIGGLLFLVFFIRQERKAVDPMLKLSLLSDRRLSSSLLANFSYLFFLYGLTFLLPFFFKYVRGDSTIETSHYLAVFPLVSMVIMPLVGRFCDRVGSKLPALIGMGSFCLAALLISFFSVDTSTVAVVATFSLLGVGMAFFGTAILAMTMTHATPESMGMISGLKAFFPIFGGLLGITFFSSLFSHAIEAAGTAVEQAPPALVAESFSHSMNLAIMAVLLGFLFTLLAGPKK
ncbi:MAG: MFS transporter [Thermodesulfobacteriota bacterium]